MAITTIPRTYELIVPLLKHIASGEEFRIIEIIAALAKQFHLTDEELMQKNKSGTKIFDSHVRWSRNYLKWADLLEQTRRGCVRITQEGQKLLENPPTIINDRFFNQYSGYAEKKADYFLRFKERIKPNDADDNMVQDRPDTTPEQAMSEAQQLQEDAVADEILERVRTVSSRGFEELILKLLNKMGYSFKDDSGRHLGSSGGGRIDGVIKQDALGLDRVYIQAKRYRDEASVGSAAIREFSGSLNEQRVQKGLFITSSAFSKSAIDAARNVTQDIVLINGRELVRLMLKHDVGVRVKTTYTLKDVDEDFFEDL